ncbi:MAG: hypothetical protein H0U61_07195, partial [Nocardioidaceae bacterium]|nr:hypothetical protein [Nocardioidaceae bacterium]
LADRVRHEVENRGVSPLPFEVDLRAVAGRHDSGPECTGGVELSPAYSEMNDPVVQRERLMAQSLLAALGDTEAMDLDESFLRALEYGMPPAGGMGMGVDRLVMLFCGVGIRESILFPTVRPES